MLNPINDIIIATLCCMAMQYEKIVNLVSWVWLVWSYLVYILKLAPGHQQTGQLAIHIMKPKDSFSTTWIKWLLLTEEKYVKTIILRQAQSARPT